MGCKLSHSFTRMLHKSVWNNFERPSSQHSKLEVKSSNTLEAPRIPTQRSELCHDLAPRNSLILYATYPGVGKTESQHKFNNGYR